MLFFNKFWLLARRKDKSAAAKKMNMQVKNCLSSIGISIYYNPIAARGKAFFAGDLRGGQKQMAESFFIRTLSSIERIEMFSRNYQNMRRCLRRDVVEGNANSVVKHNIGGDCSCGDLTKNTIFPAHVL